MSPATMNTTSIEIKRDGLTLRGFQTIPEEGEFDVAVLFHGFIQDCGRHTEDLMYQISETLNAAGIATVRVDFNGHGESDGELAGMSVLNELCDASAVISYAKNLPGAHRLFLVGHSQGGVIASIMAGFYPDWIDRVATTSAAVTLRDDAEKGDLMGTPYDPDHVPETIAAMSGKIVCGGFYFRTNRRLPIEEWASHYTGPVCINHCRGDAIVPFVAAERLHAAFPNNELHLYDGGNHSFREEIRPAVLETIREFMTR